jgi:hypothetical protein
MIISVGEILASAKITSNQTQILLSDQELEVINSIYIYTIP